MSQLMCVNLKPYELYAYNFIFSSSLSIFNHDFRKKNLNGFKMSQLVYALRFYFQTDDISIEMEISYSAFLDWQLNDNVIYNMGDTISDYTYSANIFSKTTEGVFSVKLTVLRSINMYLRAILKHLYCAADCRFDRKYSFHCLSKKHLDISSKICEWKMLFTYGSQHQT